MNSFAGIRLNLYSTSLLQVPPNLAKRKLHSVHSEYPIYTIFFNEAHNKKLVYL